MIELLNQSMKRVFLEQHFCCQKIYRDGIGDWNFCVSQRGKRCGQLISTSLLEA